MRRSIFRELRSLLAQVLLLAGLYASAGPLPGQSPRPPGPAPAKTIVFFGDSLTAGYGLPDPGTEAYPALIQKKIDHAGLGWRVVNAGISGDTSSDGLRRAAWTLRQPVGIFVLALGANDGLRGLSPALIEANLRAIIAKVRAAAPEAKIVLAGMRMPPSMGPDYVARFDAVFPAVAREENVFLIPFLLENVGGHPDLNQADGLHPTPEGATVVAATVWQSLLPLLTGR